MAATFEQDIIPHNDEERLVALHGLNILNSGAEESFDNITKIVAQVFDAPMSFISLVDKEEVFYKSQVGPFGRNAVLRQDSLCSYTILGRKPLVIEDASVEACFENNPYVVAPGGLRFYAGAPLMTKEGHPIGTVCIVDTKARSFSEEDKSLLMRFAQMVMHDIELRHIALLQAEAEKALLINTERFELVAKATHDAVWDWNLQTDEIWWNEGFKVLFGYSDEEIEPTIDSWYNRVHLADKERVVQGIHSVIDNGGENWSDEYRFRRKDGSYAIVLDRGYAVLDENGKPYRMLGSMQDITDSKRAEAALRQSEASTRLAVEAANLGTFQINVAEQTMMHSPRAAEIIGKNSSIIWPYQTFLDAVHPDDLAIRQKAHEEANKTGKLFYEARIILPDQSIHWLRLNGSLLKIENTLFLIGTMMDITEEKKAAELLEKRIEERTKELEMRNSELEQFTFVSHHDLQEPLRKITIFTHMVMDESKEKLSATAQSRLAKVVEAAKRMSQALRDVLDFASLNKVEQFSKVDLKEVLAAISSDLELIFQEKGAKLYTDALPTLEAIPVQMHQLFYNLISNALKFTKPGCSPTITVHYRMMAPSELQQHPDLSVTKQYHHISVEDNGIGFAGQHREKIFTLFHRLHHRADYAGTGIGLALVKKVVLNHKGKVWADGKEGEGATFNILLPADQLAASR